MTVAPTRAAPSSLRPRTRRRGRTRRRPSLASPSRLRDQGGRSPGAARYDGGPNEGSADVTTANALGVMSQTGAHRYDGGPNEGSADIQFRGSKAAATPQTDSPGYDGGPVSRHKGEAEHSSSRPTLEVCRRPKFPGRPSGRPQQGARHVAARRVPFLQQLVPHTPAGHNGPSRRRARPRSRAPGQGGCISTQGSASSEVAACAIKATQATISTPKTTAVKGQPRSPVEERGTFISDQYPPLG